MSSRIKLCSVAASCLLTTAVLSCVSGAVAENSKSETVGACAARGLRMSVGHTYAEGGAAGGVITFTNVAHAPCSLKGWPQVLAIAPGGRVARAATTQARQVIGRSYPATRRVLAEGASAGVAFVGQDGTGSGRECGEAFRQFAVVPPDQTVGMVVRVSIKGYPQGISGCAHIRTTPVLSIREVIR
jgi:hypothetical protein